MTDHQTTSFHAHSRSFASGIPQPGPIPGLVIAAILLIAAASEYIVTEAITAAAWKTPAYSYASNWISDLGAPDCSTFQGRVVCSPLHDVMNTGFILQGILFLIASILLWRLFSGGWRSVFLLLAFIYSLGITLVGVFHGSTAATANGTIIFHYLGAFLAILSGNTAAIVMERQRLDMPRWYSRISSALGFLGIACGAVLGLTIGHIPPGILERASVYTILLWQLLTGIVLLVNLRQRSLIKDEENTKNRNDETRTEGILA